MQVLDAVKRRKGQPDLSRGSGFLPGAPLVLSHTEYEKKGEERWKKCNFAEGKKNNGRIDEERQDVRLLKTYKILYLWVFAVFVARALRAPAFLGSLKHKAWCCAPLPPPIAASLLLSE
jgi:hypothetical protein